MCDEQASFFEVRVPNMEQKICDKCHTTHDPHDLIWDFCSWECLFKFVHSFAGDGPRLSDTTVRNDNA